MVEGGWRLQRWIYSLLVSDGKSCQLVAFPKLRMAGFQEAKERTVGLFAVVKLLTLYFVGKLLLIHV